MLLENYQSLQQVISNFYIKHNNNVKLICRETPKGVAILGTYSCKTLFSRDDSSEKTINRTFSNNQEFLELIERMNLNIKNVVEDKKYVIIAGISEYAFIWLKYYCCVEYLICEKFNNALFLESSIIAAGKEFMPSKIDLEQIIENKQVNMRISSDIVKVIDKRNIFFKF